jgi:cytochrome bd-type quinol oxidase subunit 2
VEFRNHIQSPVWIPLWDFVFCISSLLLCVFFGAALGNVVRGVPVDASAWASRLESSTDPPSSLASPRYSLS